MLVNLASVNGIISLQLKTSAKIGFKDENIVKLFDY